MNLGLIKIKIQINKAMLSYKEGDIVIVSCDQKGTPLEKYWRDRLRDAKYDNCIEVVEEKLDKKDLSKPSDEGEKEKEEVKSKNKKKGNKGEG